MDTKERIQQIKQTADKLEKSFKETKMPEHAWYATDVKFLLGELATSEHNLTYHIDALNAERLENERLRDRNWALAPKAAIYQAQNKIMREALEWILGVTEYCDRNDWGALDSIDRKARQALERIDEAMSKYKPSGEGER